MKNQKKEKERLEAEKQEFERKTEELEKIRSYWSDSMLKDFENIKRVLYTIKHNSFSIIPTTKAEIYALIYSMDIVIMPYINIQLLM